MSSATMTSKGQLTIPIELRRVLGWEGGKKYEFVREGDELIVRPARSVTERTAGMLAKYGRDRPATREEEREAFERAIAEEVAGRGW